MLTARCVYVAVASAVAVSGLPALSPHQLHVAHKQHEQPGRLELNDDPSHISLNFAHASLTCNNLGGQGPDDDCDDMLYYENISVGYDLKLVATTEYVPKNVNNNGLSGDFGILNLKKDQHVDVIATLIDADTGTELTRGKSFFITIWDIDQGQTDENGIARLQENVTVSPIYKWSSMQDPWFEAYQHYTSDRYSFVSRYYGSRANNPTDQDNITEEQKNRAVGVYFENRTSFFLSLTTGGGGNGGRNIQFGGESWLSKNLEAKTAPCLDYSDILVTDVLLEDFTLEDAGIRYKDATLTAKGEHADMFVSADRNYVAWDDSMNGLNGSAGQINQITGTEVLFTVSFFAPGTFTPVTVDRLFFSVLDLDATKIGTEALKISSTNFSSYYMSETTDLQVTRDDAGMVSFTSRAFGTEADNPSDPHSLTPLQQDRAVSFFFDSVNQFSFSFVVEKAWTGRNFLFGGVTNMACPAEYR